MNQFTEVDNECHGKSTVYEVLCLFFPSFQFLMCDVNSKDDFFHSMCSVFIDDGHVIHTS